MLIRRFDILLNSYAGRISGPQIPIKAPIDCRSTFGTRRIIARIFLAPLTDVWIHYARGENFNGSVNSWYFIFHTILRIVGRKILHIFTDEIEIAAYKNPILNGGEFIVRFLAAKCLCKQFLRTCQIKFALYFPCGFTGGTSFLTVRVAAYCRFVLVYPNRFFNEKE